MVARTSQTSSARPERPSSAMSCVANSATSISSLFGTSAKTRARFATVFARLLRVKRRAQSCAMARENCGDCAAAASRTASGRSNSSVSRSATTVALRGSFSSQPDSRHQLAAFDLGHDAFARSRAHAQPAARHQIYSVRHGAGRRTADRRPAARNGRRRPRASRESRAPRPAARLNSGGSRWPGAIPASHSTVLPREP